ncbi:SDR family oxidoreductase [Roseomonas sp. NAR14]|uniref:SDR family oxidoreductase n=1 Tax=Roseomonas acroporae TaxID=2937791 RepID=A0A9X1YCP7_9PROT|nr:SDR family oxidoreductase [Roseomonas acroporae]MCK8787357.1 SDR family oxidoreductase [Roseomonas acroporae]
MRATEMFDLTGRVAVVTGGASGLGLAYAEAMVENGARVVLMDVDGAAVAAAARRLGAGAHGEAVDVLDRAGLRGAFEAVAAREGRIDVVFANAGIDVPPGYLGKDGTRATGRALEDVPDEIWDRIIGINLTGVFVTVQAAARQMRAQGGGGSIVVTTSVAGQRASPMPAFPYMPAKAGAAHLVRQLALELAAYGIRVNAIAPGMIATAIGGGHTLTEAVQAGVARKTPLRRMGQPEDVKGAALLLASAASSYITGTEIVIDGGRMLGLADPG